MITNQTIALDSCVVIPLMEGAQLASELKQSLRGKSIRFVICDMVVAEVNRLRGYTVNHIVSKLSKVLGREVDYLATNGAEKSYAEKLSDNYHQCHRGDNIILAFCKLRDFILMTFDKALLTISGLVGVPAFHPLEAGGI